MTETLTRQAEQKISLIDRSLTITPTAISKKIILEGVTAALSTGINSTLSYPDLLDMLYYLSLR
jgi:hypothetical protein